MCHWIWSWITLECKNWEKVTIIWLNLTCHSTGSYSASPWAFVMYLGRGKLGSTTSSIVKMPVRSSLPIYSEVCHCFRSLSLCMSTDCKIQYKSPLGELIHHRASGSLFECTSDRGQKQILNRDTLERYSLAHFKNRHHGWTCVLQTTWYSGPRTHSCTCPISNGRNQPDRARCLSTIIWYAYQRNHKRKSCTSKLRGGRSQFIFNCGPCTLETVERYKYLGVFL